MHPATHIVSSDDVGPAPGGHGDDDPDYELAAGAEQRHGLAAASGPLADTPHRHERCHWNLDLMFCDGTIP